MITLQDFTSEQIIDFTYRWHSPRLSTGRTTENQSEQLNRAISESPSVRDLAGNPLLLTILAFMNGRRELPQDRFGVYVYAIDVLAWHWDTNRAVGVGTTTIDHIKEDAIRELLRQVARRIQDSDGGIGANRMGRTVLLAEIELYLRHRFEQPLKEAAADAARILDQLRDRNFLLTEFEPGVYGFVHRAVLEYCVADELLNRPAEAGSTTTLDDVVRSVFRRHAHDPAWQEALLLVASKVSAPLHLGVLEQLAADAGAADDFAPEDRLRLLTFGLRCIRENAPSPSEEIELRNRLASELGSELERDGVGLVNDLDIVAPALRELEAIVRSNTEPILTEPNKALGLPPWLGTYATGRAAITEMDKVLSVLRLGMQFKGTLPLHGISQSQTERAADRTDRPTVFHPLRNWSPFFRRKDR